MSSGVRRAPRRSARTRVTLSEEDGVRYLHFGTEWIQGGMRIARPWQLELEYQKQMMTLALLLPEPRQILQLGLGAAALTKFCYRNLPSAQLKVVELSAEVIDVARRHFFLPADDDRLQVIEQEARTYLREQMATRCDWLQVDLYDAAARGPVHDDVDFYRLCRHVLRRPGVACFNLFGAGFEASFQAISIAFDGRVLASPSIDEGNRIAFAVVGPRLDASALALSSRAAQLEKAWRLPLRRWLGALLEANALTGRLRL